MAPRLGPERRNDANPDALLRLDAWRPTERHIQLGVSHPSDDPTRHRTFEIRASYDPAAGGWVARVGEQNLNEQRGDWLRVGLAGDQAVMTFPTAAECLGHAVAIIVARVDRDAGQS